MSLKIRDKQKVKILSQDKVGVNRVFITGSSGSGKSTLLRALSNVARGEIEFPVRYVSRQLRKDDDLNENAFLGFDEFPASYNSSKLEFFWPKFLPTETVLYGFGPCSGRSIVYGCNNEFLLNRKSITSRTPILDEGVVVHVACAQSVREERLGSRYQGQAVPKEEFNYRIAANDGVDASISGLADVVVDNSDGDIRVIAQRLAFELFGSMKRG